MHKPKDKCIHITIGKSRLSMLHMLYNTMATTLLIQELSHSCTLLLIQAITTI